ncbi:MAG TPA: hypothetical protein VF606_12495 [Geminicoccaceae bacterium]
MRATTTAAAGLFCLLLSATTGRDAAAAGSLCDGLFVPDGYALTCETRIEGTARTEQAVVRPGGGGTTGVALAQLTLRPLDRAVAPLAWTEPDRWLEEQVAFDVTGIGTAVRGLGADAQGPTGHPAAQALLDGLMATLAGWGRLPLQGCAKDEAGGDDARRELRCRWGVVPLTLSMNQRLVEAGERRYALSYWAVDEQRMRHLEAIANSFAPPPPPA